MKRDTFSLRKTFLKPISKLTDAQRGRLFKAIYQYQCGETPELTDDIAVHFSYFESEFEEEEAKRRRRAEKAAERRRKALADGGKAVKTKKSAKEPEPKAAPANDLAHFDNRLVEVPANMEVPVRDQLARSCEMFKENIRLTQRKTYDDGAKDLTVKEFYNLRRIMEIEVLAAFAKQLDGIENWNSNGHTFYQYIMKLYCNRRR